ncbi:RHS repeat-associated core domain-containing protein [Hydrocarboniphaga effusa]|jgi:RHS repeat-associated protein
MFWGRLTCLVLSLVTAFHSATAVAANGERFATAAEVEKINRLLNVEQGVQVRTVSRESKSALPKVAPMFARAATNTAVAGSGARIKPMYPGETQVKTEPYYCRPPVNHSVDWEFSVSDVPDGISVTLSPATDTLGPYEDGELITTTQVSPTFDPRKSSIYNMRVVVSGCWIFGGVYDQTTPAAPVIYYADCCEKDGDGIDSTNLASGASVYGAVDYRGPDGLSLTRNYRGNSWSLGLGLPLFAVTKWTDGDTGEIFHTRVTISYPDGRLVDFYSDFDENSFRTARYINDKLQRSGSVWTLTEENGTVTTYDENSGNLIQKPKSGPQLTRGNIVATSDPEVFTARVTAESGQYIEAEYHLAASGQYVVAKTPGGKNFTYQFGATLNLQSVTFPDGEVHSFTYGSVASGSFDLWGPLLNITNSSGISVKSWAYDNQNRVTATAGYGGENPQSISYLDAARRTVTNANGTRTVQFTTSGTGGPKYYINSNDVLCSACANKVASSTLNASGQLETVTDFNGNITRYEYSAGRDFATSITEGYGKPEAKTSTYQWHPTLSLPVSVVTGNLSSAFTYDTSGNLLLETTTDSQSATSRTTAYGRDATGRVISIDGPRPGAVDTTLIDYYACTTGGKCGQVASITNAVGHVTHFNSYNGDGQVTQKTDPNGLVTTLTYWPSGLVKEITEGSEVTKFEYWLGGLLKKVTYPNGFELSYLYNDKNRLTDIEDIDGNRIHYTLDLLGNETKVEIFDASNVLVKEEQRSYNALNQLWKITGAYSGEVTEFQYDGNGNLSAQTDPGALVTSSQYDAIGRLTKVTNAAFGEANYAFNELSQNVSVQDPLNVLTQKTHNAFGDVLQNLSLDAGSNSASYDLAGNVISATDAKNQTTTYTYDGLNRLTSVTYAGAASISLVWDQNDAPHGYGLGHLTSMSDASGSTNWKYDLHGRVVQKSQVTDGITLVTSYAYDAVTGQLTGLTLPSGRSISYAYSNGKLVSIKRGSSNLLTGISYAPTGEVKSWTFGNGQIVTRGVDLDGRIVSDAVTSSIIYDANSRITSYTLGNLSLLTGTHSVTYDDLSRVTSHTNGATYEQFTYDANGNRQSKTLNGAGTTYTIATGNNRLTKIGGATVNNDANGSRISYGNRSYSYDSAGRLSAYSLNSQTGSYVYNGLGQRVKKISNGTVTIFLYDEEGRMLGEYESTGTPRRETVYLENTPVVVFKAQTTPTYYVLADWRGAPRQVNDSLGQAVWVWDPNPFGEGAPDNNPLNLSSTFRYDLRYPGQYNDSESGLFYNYYRDYDPLTGRYIQADPIGLEGGLNVFSYVAGNPLNAIDPLGLQRVLPPLPEIIKPSAEMVKPADAVRPSETVDPALELPGIGSPNDPSSPKCMALAQKIQNIRDEVYDKRIPDLEANPQNLPERVSPTEKLHESVRGHRKLLDRQLRRLRELEDRYDKECSPRC